MAYSATIWDEEGDAIGDLWKKEREKRFGRRIEDFGVCKRNVILICEKIGSPAVKQRFAFISSIKRVRENTVTEVLRQLDNANYFPPLQVLGLSGWTVQLKTLVTR